jgi:oxygen-dependent protoporphyrinogen oxidase
MAQYEVGHLAKAAAIRARISLHRGLGICGNGFEGVGVPDCIHAGERTAEELMKNLGL